MTNASKKTVYNTKSIILVMLTLTCLIVFAVYLGKKSIPSNAEYQKPHESDKSNTAIVDRPTQLSVHPIAPAMPEAILLLGLNKLPNRTEISESILREILVKEPSNFKKIHFYHGIKENDNTIIQPWLRCDFKQCVGAISIISVSGEHFSILKQVDLPVPVGVSPWRLDGIGVLRANVLHLNNHRAIFLHYRVMGPPGREVGSASYDFLVVFGLSNLSQELWQEITNKTGQEVDPEACSWSVKRGPVKENGFEDLQVIGCNGPPPITRTYYWDSINLRYLEYNQG